MTQAKTPTSYVIHLPDVPESVNSAKQLLRQLRQYKMPAKLFCGTRGDAAVKKMDKEHRTLHPWGIKGPDAPVKTTVDEEDSRIHRPGVKGCFYSHYRLWQRCVEKNQPIFIWEDDIVLTSKYRPVEWQDVLILALGHPTKSIQYLDHLNNSAEQAQAMEYHRSSMPGCCGYAIHPHAAQKLLDVYANTYLPADNAINHYHVTIEIHSHVMGIAQVEGKKSLTSTKTFWNEKKQ